VNDDFDGPDLDLDLWLPHYLPAWSSREATAASYRLEDSHLVLDLPREHPVWLEDVHEPRLRVSGMQSASRSGPVGSTDGQQAVHIGQLVREEQPEHRGHLQSGGHLEVTCSMLVTPTSMAALWLCGFQEQPDDNGELCVVEVFGKDVEPGRSAEVGVGVKAIHDPRLTNDFAAPRLPIDVSTLHTYAVDWDADGATFSVDGEVVRRCAGPPAYPLQVMVGVFDWPDLPGAGGAPVPELRIDRIRTSPSRQDR
jgi:hypothetical protein